MRPFPVNKRRAFSLLEILTATAVLSLLMLGLVQIFSQTSRLWVAAKRQSEHSLNCRAAGDFIAEELRRALLPLDLTAQNSLQFVVNPGGISSDYRHRDAVFWQAPIVQEAKSGDVAEIGYFVKWDTSGTRPRPLLCRFFVAPMRNGSANSNFRIYTYPSDWVNNTVLAAVAPANSANDYEGLFAENIVGLWVECQDSAGAALSTSFDSRQNSYVDSGDGETRRLPRRVKVSLLSLDATSAARLTEASMTQIEKLVADSNDAAACRDAAIQSSSLRGIAEGLRFYSATVYLENAR